MTHSLYKHNPRILIVDDFISNIQVLANMLKPHEYEIEFTTSGQEALEWLKQDPFDLVLLDIMMPEMDGFEVCEKLKADEKTKNIPIIFITAKTDEVSIQKGLQAGAVDYIVKPYRETEMLERVKTHLTLEGQRKALINNNQAKDRLFSIIGHDLKNPMSNIYGFLKLLHENYDNLNDDKRKKYINYTLESAKHNLTLLEELLEWSRTQTNTKPFKPVTFKIQDLIDEVLTTIKSSAAKKNIEIKTSINITGRAYADINMIKTVLRNLVNNAIKFTNQGGTISIQATDYKNEKILIEVQDTGVGIPEKNLNKLFLIDEHISTQGTNDEKGTGLGLILCKEFIDKHKEAIWAESKLNKGSTFSFTLQNTLE